jgi:hypothetical protein
MNTKKFPEWKQAVDNAISEFDHGDLVSFKWLYEQFGISPPKSGTAEQFKEFQFKFLSYIENFKETLLLEHCMYLSSVRGDGYLVVEVDDQTSIAWDRMKKKIASELRKTERAITNIKYDRLGDRGRAENTVKVAVLFSIKTFVKKSFRGTIERNILSTRTEIEVSQPGSCGNDSEEVAEKKDQE